MERKNKTGRVPATRKFQSPISGVNDWNGKRYDTETAEQMFQSPISGVNDWNPPRCTVLL